ncbi:Arc family DNA-binding protein [Acinetobacter sp. YH12073]|uniref:Arc family DNA-binding protein n=1 Tax=Acinetobacter sp. YH12073 TaxID=2601069 RepID=UPI0015D0F206|nr:Arc family DNA-binding protein [Acinetobacter sp. YH12073]
MSENQKEPQYKLRWSEELRDKVVESAKLHSRSINAEICTRLEESFNETGLVASDPYKRMLLANVAMIVASEADNPNPSFTRAMDRITKAIMVDEKQLFNVYGDLKNQEK